MKKCLTACWLVMALPVMASQAFVVVKAPEPGSTLVALSCALIGVFALGRKLK